MLFRSDIGGTNNASFAIAEGKIYAWGTNGYGVTGRNLASSDTLTPSLVTASNTATTLPTGYTATALGLSGSRGYNMCAVADGKAYCWGQRFVGDGTTNQRNVPTKVTDTGVLSGKTISMIAQDGYVDSTSGYVHTCALATDSRVYCWGEGQNGALGQGVTNDRSSPIAVDWSGVLAGKNAQEVKVGLRHTCIRADGGAYCFGVNNQGQVGDGTSTTPRLSPVAVYQQAGALTSSNVISIGAGANRGCAIVTDGRSFCWGLNNSGQIGDGTTINRTSPTESLFLRPTGNQYIF